MPHASLQLCFKFISFSNIRPPNAVTEGTTPRIEEENDFDNKN